MTDNKDDQIDFEKEIEELDSFLDGQEDIDFVLDDNNDSAPVFAEKNGSQNLKKGGFGKILGYLILIFILCSGGYAVYLLAPQYIEKPQLDKVSAFVSSESGDVVGDLTQTIKSYIPTSDNTSIMEPIESEDGVSQEMMDPISDLPVPSDQGLVEVEVEKALSIADAMDFVKDATTDVVNEPEIVDTQAEDIMNELNDMIPDAPTITQDSDLPVLPNEVTEIIETVDSVMVEDVVDVVEDMTPSVPENEISNESIMNGVENEQADPSINDIEVTDNTEEENIPTAPAVIDLPALKEDTIAIANDVMEMPKEDLVEIVETIENVTVEEVVEISEEENIPTAPATESLVVVEVEVQKAVPVKVETPKKVNPKPSKPIDTRVINAKSLFDKGDYAGALELYQAVLNSDPANTSALTGRQLAQAKLRVNGVVPRPTVEKTIEPTQTVDNDLASLLQQSQANPRDALLAFKVGNAYKGADNIKAMEWYRRSLQLDVLQSSGLDRMAVYDAMADIQ